MLVHGIGLSHRYVLPTARRLAPEFPVHAVDLPGFGLSSKPWRVLGVPELAASLAGWIQARGLGPVALLGNSFGCQIIAELAARRPELVRCVVLQGPTMDPETRTPARQTRQWLRNDKRENLNLAQRLVILRGTTGTADRGGC